jgi:hypothetical protein
MENPFAASPISRNQSNANADSDVEVDMILDFWGCRSSTLSLK